MASSLHVVQGTSCQSSYLKSPISRRSHALHISLCKQCVGKRICQDQSWQLQGGLASSAYAISTCNSAPTAVSGTTKAAPKAVHPTQGNSGVHVAHLPVQGAGRRAACVDQGSAAQPRRGLTACKGATAEWQCCCRGRQRQLPQDIRRLELHEGPHEPLLVELPRSMLFCSLLSAVPSTRPCSITACQSPQVTQPGRQRQSSVPGCIWLEHHTVLQASPQQRQRIGIVGAQSGAAITLGQPPSINKA